MRFLLLLTLLISPYSFGQDRQGYYITSNKQRVEGYFRNSDLSDANSLKFKLNPDDKYETLDVRDVSEYGVEDAYKFIKRTVKIDKSDNINAKYYSTSKEPKFITETLFLNVLVEGVSASLYSVKSNKSIRYFYTLVDKEQFSQLIYKRYSLPHNIIGTSTLYKRQMFIDLNCNNKPEEYFKKIEYSRDDLTSALKEFNTCKKATSLSTQINGDSLNRLKLNAVINQ